MFDNSQVQLVTWQSEVLVNHPRYDYHRLAISNVISGFLSGGICREEFPYEISQTCVYLSIIYLYVYDAQRLFEHHYHMNPSKYQTIEIK